MLLSALSASAADVKDIAPDVVGAWRLTFTTPDGVERTPTVVVGRQRDELVAWYIEKGEPEAFKDVRVADESLELTIVPREKDGKATVKLVAKADGDGCCRGKAECRFTDGDTGKWEFTGQRIDLSELNHVAQWKLSFTTPEGEKHEPTIHVFEKGDTLYGWYISDDYELLAKSLKVEGDHASLAIAAQLSDGAIANVTFRGTIDGSSVSGDADYDADGERGSFSFTGRQVVN
jgi:hypothetical protein